MDNVERSADAEAGALMTIDELAAAAQLPSRTIRYYQSRGALMPPEIRGRVAYYGAQHVERLKLIGQLKARGLRIRAIRDLVKRLDQGGYDLGEWLGIEETLKTAWVEDHPQLVDRAGLERLLGDNATPEYIEELCAANLVRREQDAFLISSPGLLQMALRLESAGVSLTLSVGAFEILQRRISQAAGELAAYFNKHAERAFGVEPTAEQMRQVFEALRPTALSSVRLVFAREMEAQLREMVRSGEAARVHLAQRKKPRVKGR